MAVRTGTQLGADQDAADTALAAAIVNPSDANIASAVSAFQTVETNARDSKITESGYTRRLDSDIHRLAREARKELQTLQAKGSNNPSADRIKVLKRLQVRLNRGPWAAYRQLPKTD